MKNYTRNIGEVLHLIVSQTEENLTTLKETLHSFRTKVKSNGLYLILVMVFAHLAHMLVRGIYWIFNRNVNLSKSHNQELSKLNHICYEEEI